MSKQAKKQGTTNKEIKAIWCHLDNDNNFISMNGPAIHIQYYLCSNKKNEQLLNNFIN
jgi:hypothetical protein